MNIISETFGKSKIAHEYFEIFLRVLLASRPLHYYHAKK
jgi:hypothetical protein